MGKKEFFGPASRLIEAQYKQSFFYNMHPVYPDLSAKYEAIAAWATVTCTYSGIEQAMKCLMQMRGTYIHKSRSQGGHKHHDIGKLFQDLASDEQEVLRVSYAIYRSLHEYIPPETVDCFLDEIDDGYPTWRYFLLEGVMPPTTHPGAMVEIWSALTQLLKARAFKNHGLTTVKQRIDFRLREIHLNAAKKECIDLEQINSIVPWRRRDTFVDINQYIELLSYDANGQPLQIIQPTLALPPVLSMPRVLHRFVDKVKGDTTDNDFMHFRFRARIGGLNWNAGGKSL